MSDAPELLRGIPVLASLNMDETVAFYTRLGFTVLSRYDAYLIIRRDAVTLHFWACTDRHIAENTSCYVDVTGVDALYAQYEPHGVIHPNGKLADQPWGMREFSILDVHGNLIRFGEQRAAGS
jgi:catechol 2,3-dioxygenase-like lactoylglutathione lyase family enzyme